MNILFAIEYFPPFAPGGAEWSAFYQAKELVKRGHKVTVVTPNYGAAAKEVIDGITVERFWFPKKLEPGQNTVSHRWLANWFFYTIMAVKIVYVARRNRADILHAQHRHALIPVKLAGMFLSLIRQKVGTAVTLRDYAIICQAALCLHTSEFIPKDCGFSKLWKECSNIYIKNYIQRPTRFRKVKTKLSFSYLWVDQKIKQFFLRRVNVVIGISKGMIDIYKQAGLVSDNNSVVVYNPGPDISEVEFSVNRTSNNNQTIFYAGKFSLGKGTADLVEATSRLHGSYPRMKFILIGKGHLDISEEQRSYISTYGSITHIQLLNTMNEAAIVVMPSVWQEPFGRILVEAMALGKPVIGTRVGGIPELIDDGVNGILVDRSNPEALAKAIQELVDNPARAIEMGRKGEEIVGKKFSSEISANKLIKIYSILRAKLMHERQSTKYNETDKELKNYNELQEKLRDYYKKEGEIDYQQQLYSTNDWKHNRLKNVVVDQVISLVAKTDTVLDLGCAEGLYLRSIAKFVGNGVGVDISPGKIDRAKKYAEGLKNLRFIVAEVARLPFSKNSFDKVICIETLEHVPDYRSALKYIHEILRPGGWLILSVPTEKDERLGSHKLSLKWEDKSGHLHSFSGYGMSEALIESGFELDRTLPVDILGSRLAGIIAAPLVKSIRLIRVLSGRAGKVQSATLSNENKGNNINNQKPKPSYRFWYGQDEILARIPLINRRAGYRVFLARKK